jgi:hypothetical protein
MRDASADVMAALRQRTEPLSVTELVELLKNAHDEAAIVKALEHWRASGEAVQDVEGRWGWIGP